ncbi:MAG: alpha/beta hydrolase, partial [Thermoanaerobaculaceae bacterium]|nr:alpha/beta hydrolase [Thermoanaerobaculaceae bacterium]
DAADGFEAEWLVDDLEAFVDAVGLRTFHLVGYSMGAMTALGYAVRAPEREWKYDPLAASPYRR